MIIDFRKVITPIFLYALLVVPVKAMPSCLPADGEYQKLSEYRDENKLYSYYFGTFENAPNRTFVSLEENSGCEIIASDDPEGTGVLILDSYLDEEIARNLYLNLYSDSIARAGSLESFQQAVDSLEGTIDEPFEYVSPAEEWALLELGVELPEDRVIASVDPEEERVYRLLDSIGSPAFDSDSIENIRFSSEYILASFIQDESENIVFARLLEDGGIEYIFSGLEDEYNPEMLSYEHQIPLSIFEGFEE